MTNHFIVSLEKMYSSSFFFVTSCLIIQWNILKKVVRIKLNST